MAQDLSATQKADLMAHRFFSKFALIVDNARAPVEPRDSATAKIDTWFNIKIPDPEKYKDHLRAYRSISTLSSPPPPFELQVLLTIPELTNNQVLVLHDPPASRVRVDPTPSHILLESWQLEFAPSPAWYSSGTNTSCEVTLSAVYKHGICLYRSLFALLRVLPTWRLYQRAGLGPTRNGALGFEMCIGPLSTDTDGSHVLGFDTPLSTSSPPPRTSTHTFTPITHPLGVITLSTTYLAAPHFHLDTLESLLYSHFLSLDAGPEFTPILARTRESTSVTTSASHEHSGSPGSPPMRNSLPRSPSSATAAIAERFVLPAPGVGPSPQRQLPFPTTVSPRSRNIALPALAPGSTSSSPRAPSVTGNFSTSGGSSRLSQEGASANLSAVYTRLLEDKVAKAASRKCSVEEFYALHEELHDLLTAEANTNSEVQPISLLLSAALLRVILSNHYANGEVIKNAEGVIANLRLRLDDAEKRETELNRQLREYDPALREERADNKKGATDLTENDCIPRGRSTRVKSISPPSQPRHLGSRGIAQSNSTGHHPARNASIGPSRFSSPTRSTFWSPSENFINRPGTPGTSPSNHSSQSYSADHFTLAQDGVGHRIRRSTSRSSNPPISPLFSPFDDAASRGAKGLHRSSSFSSELARAKSYEKSYNSIWGFKYKSAPVGSQKLAARSASTSQSEAAGRSNVRNDYEREGREQEAVQGQQAHIHTGAAKEAIAKHALSTNNDDVMTARLNYQNW